MREEKFTLDGDVNVDKLDGLQVHVHLDEKTVSGELKSKGEINVGPAKLSLLEGCKAELQKGKGLSAHLHASLAVDEDRARRAAGRLQPHRRLRR